MTTRTELKALARQMRRAGNERGAEQAEAMLAATPKRTRSGKTITTAEREAIDVANTLLAHLRTLAPDLPAPVRDLPFQSFRVDLAWPAAMLAVEVNGGLKRAGGGKHSTSRDHQKVRRLVLDGWRVLIFTSSEVRAAPIDCIADIRLALSQSFTKQNKDFGI